jgi:arylsulfatase A-like enzyme
LPLDLERRTGAAFLRAYRGAFWARRAQAALRRQLTGALGHETAQARRERESENELRAGRAAAADRPRGRNILFVTVDQQRYDALAVNGGRVARTPVLDDLARSGINYRRAHVQNVVCMPSRATILTGQHPRTHGVIANGIALPENAPSIARHLRSAGGYRTALIGKAHFEPHLDPRLRFFENRAAAKGCTGPWRGFEHVEFAGHGSIGGHHYAAWLWQHHPEDVPGFAPVLTGAGGGDTGAPEVAHNPIPREHYHTDWVADRTIAWLESLQGDGPWFCWMSFPDPHHPFDPPIEEVRKRIDWHDLKLPERHPGSRGRAEQVLANRPRHWLEWYRGRFRNPEGGPVAFVPCRMTGDQMREINAMIHVENELIDEACGRVLAWLHGHRLHGTTDVIYASDHGELQGDYGLLFKGPYHVESLLRVPLIWRPAPSAGITPAEVTEPVGLTDLAPTFCRIAGIEIPGWLEGAPLPTAPGSERKRVLTTFDSQFAAVGMHLRTIYRDGYICTAYGRRTYDRGGRFRFYWSVWGARSQVPTYDGSEGELYDLREDPHQFYNLWDDPARRRLRDELLEDLYAHLPPEREPPLPVAAPT